MGLLKAIGLSIVPSVYNFLTTVFGLGGMPSLEFGYWVLLTLLMISASFLFVIAGYAQSLEEVKLDVSFSADISHNRPVPSLFVDHSSDVCVRVKSLSYKKQDNVRVILCKILSEEDEIKSSPEKFLAPINSSGVADVGVTLNGLDALYFPVFRLIVDNNNYYMNFDTSADPDESSYIGIYHIILKVSSEQSPVQELKYKVGFSDENGIIFQLVKPYTYVA